MKSFFSLLIATLLTVAVNAQTYALTGQITSTKGAVTIKVFEYDSNTGNWEATRFYKPSKNYGIELRQDTDYQIWFTDRMGFTKVLAVNRNTITGTSNYSLNVDFSRNESAQIIRDDNGFFALTLIDTDFRPLRTPFDLYP